MTDFAQFVIPGEAEPTAQRRPGTQSVIVTRAVLKFIEIFIGQSDWVPARPCFAPLELRRVGRDDNSKYN